MQNIETGLTGLVLFAEFYETVARLQSMLFGGELSLAEKSRQKPKLTFESATTVGQELPLANLDGV